MFPPRVLQEYAQDFLYLPNFKQLADGSSSKTWRIFVADPHPQYGRVLSLGLVGRIGMRPHLWGLCYKLHLQETIPAVAALDVE